MLQLEPSGRHGRVLSVILLSLSLALWGCGGGGNGSLGEPAGQADVREPDSGGGGPVGDTGGGNPSRDTGGGGQTENGAPVLQRIGDRAVPVGETLEFELVAEDPDGDDLTFSVFGDVPKGAEFDKGTHRFTWTPNEEHVDSCVYVTFVVSDSKDFDRETVQICVTGVATPHPPEFVRIPSQYPVVGERFALQLEATDPDGDALTWDIDGARPDGAALDPESGLFTWTPSATDVGPPARVRFLVSDGELEDDMEVLFFVREADDERHPPVFQPVPAQEAEVGEELRLVLQADDPDGDDLTYAMSPGGPTGAMFDADGRVFRWTPTAEHAGRSWEVQFTVTDGTFDDLLVVSVAVAEEGIEPVACDPDDAEPNDTPGTARELPIDTTVTLGICDAHAVDAEAGDIDWFALPLDAGQTLTVTLAFEHARGDIDMQLFTETGGDEPVADSSTSDDGEHLEWTAPADATSTTLVQLAVYGYDVGGFSNAYTLSATVSEQPYVCEDDPLEDNDTRASASLLSEDELTGGLFGMSLCPNDEDWYSFPLQAGDALDLVVGFAHADGDIDAVLYAPDGETVVARGTSDDDDEHLVLAEVPATGIYSLVVRGYPVNQIDTTYAVVGEVGQAVPCPADALEPNDSQSAATPLVGDPVFTGLTACADADWYAVPLAANEIFVVDLTIAEGSITARVVARDGLTTLATGTRTGTIVAVEAPTSVEAGDYYLVVESDGEPASYALELIVMQADPCDVDTCPPYGVCDIVTGRCVDARCGDDDDCPGMLSCHGGFCGRACLDEDPCREGLACKRFDEGRYCVPLAPDAGRPGAECENSDQCTGEMVCLHEWGADFCALPGCADDWDCPWEAFCVPLTDRNVCLLGCFAGDECTNPGLNCSDDYVCDPSF